MPPGIFTLRPGSRTNTLSTGLATRTLWNKEEATVMTRKELVYAVLFVTVLLGGSGNANAESWREAARARGVDLCRS